MIKGMDKTLADLYEMPLELIAVQLTQSRRKKDEALNSSNSPKVETTKNSVKDSKPIIQPLPSIRKLSSPKLTPLPFCTFQSVDPYQRPLDPPSYYPEAMRNTTDSLFQSASPYCDSPFLQRFFFNPSSAIPENLSFPFHNTPFRPTYNMSFKGTFTKHVDAQFSSSTPGRLYSSPLPQQMSVPFDPLAFNFRPSLDVANNEVYDFNRGGQVAEVYEMRSEKERKEKKKLVASLNFETIKNLSLIHICRCRRYAVCRSRWSPYH
eukprot:TRINITY_DN5159_c0_g1_i12.p1 TRINITY_DN5159_c0_g1~~TRINITY_DN5159_c0_g1_i12.p1  ORF type:complete len:264 (+),score=21.82 TRINITY_DN5159_c0_g1_i12:544-1335(+)